MTFEPRLYPEIVRDLLTVLTGGTVRESVTVPAGEAPIVLPQLAQRPVRRVSHLQGPTLVGPSGAQTEVQYRFTDADFELVSTSGGDEPDAIRFREQGRKPVPGSTVTVNYYPVQTGPVPVTDLNVGSVVRTLMETAARELAEVEQRLQHVYDSAFLETAEGASLDRVVALVGVTRLPAGSALGRVRFSREASSAGRITIPTGTAVTDAAGSRYRTVDTLTLEPGEPSREVVAAGETTGVEPVDAGALDRLEVSIAGISSVTNPEPTRRATAPESDDDLRRRARHALDAVAHGTVNALRFGVRSVPGVKDATIVEFPNGVPGELRIDVAYEREDPAVEQAVARRIEELRPAGVRVISGSAARLQVTVRVALTLAGTGASGAELTGITAGVEERLAGYLGSIAPGGRVRRAQLVRLALDDARIVDAEIGLTPAGGAGGGSEVDELTLEPGVVLEAQRPFVFPPPASEEAPGPGAAVTAQVDAVLPVHLVPGVTQAEATEAMRLALESHLTTRSAEQPLTVDGVAAAIRDDSRYALVRADALVTVESGGRFLQLTDGVGAYPPGAAETFHLRTLDVPVREGGA